MPTSSGGFEQAYNVQAGVDLETHLIVEQHVTQHTNDTQEIEPVLEAIGQLPEALGEAGNLLADTGYFSEANVEKCTAANLVPFIPEKREKHNLPLTARFTRGSRTASECYYGAGDATSLVDPGRESGLCHTQIHCGNGLWHH